MTIELLRSIDTPEGTTVASYSVDRLGRTPTVRCEYNETRRAWSDVPVVSVDAPDEAGHVTAVIRNVDTWTAGDEIYDSQKALLTTVVSVTKPAALVGSTIPPIFEATVVLASAVSPGTYYRKVMNTIGAQVYEPAPDGQRWRVQVTALADLQAFMFKIAVAMVTDVLAAAGVTKTSQEIQTLAGTMLAEDKGVDTYITAQFEQLERDRRQGLAPGVQVSP